MNSLINAIVNEFNVSGTVAVDKNFKADAAKDSVTISIKLLNSDGEVLQSKSIRFVRNQLTKAQQKLFIKTSHKNLENLFLDAKTEILTKIINENTDKINDLNEENRLLKLLTKHDFAPSVKSCQGESLVQPTCMKHSKAETKNLKSLM